VVTARHVKKIAVLEVHGDLQTEELVEVKNRMEEWMDKEYRFFVLNFRHSERIHATALGILVEELKRLRHNGGDMKLANVRGSLKRVFDLTGTASLFEIHESEKKALESFEFVEDAA